MAPAGSPGRPLTIARGRAGRGAQVQGCQALGSRRLCAPSLSSLFLPSPRPGLALSRRTRRLVSGWAASVSLSLPVSLFLSLLFVSTRGH